VHLGIVLAVAVIVSGLAAQRGFRWKRQQDAFQRHLEEKDLASRRHHFRGALDVELEQSPPYDGPPLPRADGGGGVSPEGPSETG
jgi:hypothetical protein